MANPTPLNPQVSWFAKEMQKKINENAGKGGWRQEDMIWLLGALRQEVFELETALYNLRRGGEFPEEDAHEVIREAADVGNFAMMIASNAKRDAEKGAIQ